MIIKMWFGINSTSITSNVQKMMPKKNGSRGNLHTTLEALTVEGSDCTVFVEAVAVELTFRVLWAERLLLRSWKHIRGGYGF
jgi:hypothetical protein